MNHKASNGAGHVSTDYPPKLSLPNINTNANKATLNADDMDQMSVDGSSRPAKGFKFGQVDHQMLMSRLYSTPFNKTTTNQQYALEMGNTSIHKPRIKKLEQSAPPPEPVVCVFLNFCFCFSFLYLSNKCSTDSFRINNSIRLNPFRPETKKNF